MIIPRVAADLHVHVKSNSQKATGEFVTYMLGEAKDFDVIKLFKLCNQKFPSDNTLVGITGFDNGTNYEQVLDTINSKDYDFVLSAYSEVFFCLGKCGMSRIFIRSQEISTYNGHILVVGADRNFKEDNLEDILALANRASNQEENPLIIPAHPLAAGFLEDLLSKGHTLGVGGDMLLSHLNYWDAIEAGNSNCPHYTDLIEELLTGTQAPTVYNSDSEGNELFSSYFIVNNIDISNPNRLRTSLRHGIINSVEKILGTNGRYKPLRHGLVSIYNILRAKLGIIKAH